MRRAWRLLAGFALALVLLAGGAWLALDAWLESAGGRSAIERVLGAESGYPVALAGDFEVVLLPAPGVSGTDLRVYPADGMGPMLTGGRYTVALALRPLLRREILVDSLALEDIRFGSSDDPAAFHVPRLAIEGFAVDRPAAFRVDLGPWGEAAGYFTWRPAAQGLDLEVDWGGFLVPRLWLALRARYEAAGLWFDSIAARVDGQDLGGAGCYRTDAPVALNLDLQAERLDLDAVEFALPETAAGADGAAPPVNLRLSAGEVVRGDTLAQGVVLTLGADPDCARQAD